MIVKSICGSSLPDLPDKEKAKRTLLEIRTQLYK